MRAAVSRATLTLDLTDLLPARRLPARPLTAARAAALLAWWAPPFAKPASTVLTEGWGTPCGALALMPHQLAQLRSWFPNVRRLVLVDIQLGPEALTPNSQPSLCVAPRGKSRTYRAFRLRAALAAASAAAGGPRGTAAASF